MSDLMKKLDELKLMLDYPFMYLSDYFAALKNQVDLVFASKQLTASGEQLSLINKTYEKIIHRVELFENECFKKRKNSSEHGIGELDQIRSKVFSLERILNSQISSNINELDTQIQQAKQLVQRYLFRNKTIVFLEKMIMPKETNENNLREKLLIVNDEFISDNGIITLKNKELHREIFGEYQLADEDSLSPSESVKLYLISKQLVQPLEIIEMSLKLKEIKMIRLGDRISRVQENLLSDLTDLDTLHLCYNKIKRIQPNSFRSNPKLATLDLNSNEIIRLDRDMFKNLPQLKCLFLQSNRLESMDVECFGQLTNLVELDLGHNKLSRIESNTFQGLNNLKTLVLGFNKIDTLNVCVFRDLKNLNELDLSLNKLHSLNRDIFLGLENLHTLRLNSNEITHIEPFTFVYMPHLKVLDISNNSISLIKLDFFQGIVHLKVLVLSYNKISCMEPNCFLYLANLRELILTNNRLDETQIKKEIMNLKMLNYCKF